MAKNELHFIKETATGEFSEDLTDAVLPAGTDTSSVVVVREDDVFSISNYNGDGIVEPDAVKGEFVRLISGSGLDRIVGVYASGVSLTSIEVVKFGPAKINTKLEPGLPVFYNPGTDVVSQTKSAGNGFVGFAIDNYTVYLLISNEIMK